jgi:hypothetical protein
MLILGERHLRSVLAQYEAHYDRRPPATPPQPDHPAADLSQERIKRRRVLGRLICEYERPA